MKEGFLETQSYTLKFNNIRGKALNSHASLFKRLNKILQDYEQWPQHFLNDKIEERNVQI